MGQNGTVSGEPPRVWCQKGFEGGSHVTVKEKCRGSVGFFENNISATMYVVMVRL